jgi:hypothetical protein
MTMNSTDPITRDSTPDHLVNFCRTKSKLNIKVITTENSAAAKAKVRQRSGPTTWLPVNLKAFPDSVSKAQASM